MGAEGGDAGSGVAGEPSQAGLMLLTLSRPSWDAAAAMLTAGLAGSFLLMLFSV